MKYSSDIKKKNGILSFVPTQKDTEIIMLSEINQAQKNKSHDLTHMRSLKDLSSHEYQVKQGLPGVGGQQKRWSGGERFW